MAPRALWLCRLLIAVGALHIVVTHVTLSARPTGPRQQPTLPTQRRRQQQPPLLPTTLPSLPTHLLQHDTALADTTLLPDTYISLTSTLRVSVPSIAPLFDTSSSSLKEHALAKTMTGTVRSDWADMVLFRERQAQSLLRVPLGRSPIPNCPITNCRFKFGVTLGPGPWAAVINSVALCHSDLLIPAALTLRSRGVGSRDGVLLTIPGPPPTGPPALCVALLGALFEEVLWGNETCDMCATSAVVGLFPSVRFDDVASVTTYGALRVVPWLRGRVAVHLRSAGKKDDVKPSRGVFLEGTGHTAQTASFYNTFVKNFTNTVRVPLAGLPVGTGVIGVLLGSAVMVAVHGDHVPLLVYLPAGALFVDIAPRGMTYRDQVLVERLASLAAVSYLNHRPVADSYATRTAGDPLGPFDIPWKEGMKLCIEVALFRELHPASRHPSATAQPSRDERHGATCRVIQRRNKYDPDHMRCGPVKVDSRGFSFPNNLPMGLDHEERFGYRIENHNDLKTVPMSRVEGPLACPTGHSYPDVTLFVHYPWVRDNIYHQHNDNFLPLFASFDVHNASSRDSRHLALLPTVRSQRPLPSFEEIAGHLFSKVSWMADMDPACYRAVVWGRPQRPFAMSLPDVLPYAREMVHQKFRSYMYDKLGIAAVPPPDRSPRPLVVTWIERRDKRVLMNEKVLFAAFAHHNVSVSFCCEGMSFADQVRHMASTDVLIGTHGAGLLHIVYLRPTALVAHVASRRLNYHEQTIIERMAILAGVRYLNTRTFTAHDDPTAKWEEDYRLPPPELHQIAVQVLTRYGMPHH